MTARSRVSPLAPFSVRSFRFQWPADLLTSWAFEMETLILGWYVLVETDSVLMLTVFGSLQFLGTLLAPMFGVGGDRIGRRAMLCLLRAAYALLAVMLMTLGLLDMLTPWHVIAIALLAGLVRPSDLVMRNALIGDTMPADRLMTAMSLARTTMDSARIAGALAGAGLFAALGIGPAYIAVAAFYGASLLLTLGVSRERADSGQGRADATGAVPRLESPWRALRDGLAFVWNTPQVLAIMWLAFLVNLTAYPLSHGLLPYVAREVYRVDETGLGHLVAGFASGALVGSIAMVLTGGPSNPARFMLVNILLWYGLLFALAFSATKEAGFAVLVAVGFVQSLAMVSMVVSLLRATPPQFRGRVMGVRMLAVYGLPVGLLLSGALIDAFGYVTTITAYSAVGLFLSVLTGLRWRDALWR